MQALIFYFILSHVLSFLCSILEAVILSCSYSYIALLLKKKSRAGFILNDLKQRINQPLAAILTLNTASHTFGAAGVGAKVVEIFGNYWLSLASIVVTLTMLYWTEMVPKTIGALYWKRLSVPSAYIIKILIFITYPFVVSFELLANWIGKGKKTELITQEEIKVIVEEGVKAGAIEEIEHNMVESIFRLNDRHVGILMTPRREISWIDISDPKEIWMKKVQEMPHHFFPVCDQDLNNVIGMVREKDLLAEALSNRPIDFKKIAVQPLYVHENAPIFSLFEEFKKSPLDSALVTDEYGNIEGIISLHTILESILGELFSSSFIEKKLSFKRKDGSWILDGKLPIDEFKEIFHLEYLPKEEKGSYRTVAGFCMLQMGVVPSVGDEFTWNELRFKIVKMDGRRISSVLVT